MSILMGVFLIVTVGAAGWIVYERMKTERWTQYQAVLGAGINAYDKYGDTEHVVAELVKAGVKLRLAVEVADVAEHLVTTRQQNMQADAKERGKSDPRDYYRILDIPTDATTKEIKKAYLRLSNIYHPDKHRSIEGTPHAKQMEEMFKAVSEAYRVLKDDKLRKGYDAI